MPGADAIVVEGLAKTYPNGTKAVRGVSFRVGRGEIYGILGPNGAGKSTIIGVLGTLVRPSAGRALVDGVDVVADSLGVRRRIGFAMQEAGVDGLATGLEFLVLQGRLYGLSRSESESRARDLLDIFDLTEAAAKRIKSYSGGMKRRIDLAAALIHAPPILFLDEPTEGLDPRSRRTMWEILRTLNEEEGLTVLLSTHYMEEADALCHRIGILDAGRIVAEGVPQELKAALGRQRVVLDYGPNGGAARLGQAEVVLGRTLPNLRLTRSGAHLLVDVVDASSATPAILRALDNARLPPESLRVQVPTLDDVYLHHTGRSIGEAEAAAGPPAASPKGKGGH